MNAMGSSSLAVVTRWQLSYTTTAQTERIKYRMSVHHHVSCTTSYSEVVAEPGRSRAEPQSFFE
jgi:hypothetical protein